MFSSVKQIYFFQYVVTVGIKLYNKAPNNINKLKK